MDRGLRSGFASIFSTRLLVLVVTVVTTPLLYGALGDRRLGIYATLTSIAAIVAIFVSAGISGGVRKFVAEDRPSAGWQAHVVGFYFRYALGLAAVGALVLVGAGAVLETTGLLSRFLETDPEQGLLYFVLLAAFLFTSQFHAYTLNALRGFGLEREAEPLKVVQAVVAMGAAVGLVVAGYGVAGALAGLVLGNVVVSLAGFWLLRRPVPLGALVRRAPPEFPRRQLVSFNWFSLFIVLCVTSLYHVDVLMLQVLGVRNASVGHYRAALTLAEFLWIVPHAVQALFVHSTAKLWAQDRVGVIDELAGRTTRYALLVTAVMALGLAALAETFVPVYFGEAFSPAVTPLVLLLPGALGFAVARPILAIQQGKGDLRYPLAATAAAAGLNVVINAALIPRYGVSGAAVATSVSYGSMFLFHVVSARWFVGFDSLTDARPGRVALTTLLAAGPIAGLATVLAGDVVGPVGTVTVPVSLVVVPPVGLAVFLLAAFATRALEPAEVRDVLEPFVAPVASAVRSRSG